MNISSKLQDNPRAKTKQDLENCAFGIAERYQQGAFVELKGVGWQMTWIYLLKDLRACCSGFSEVEYGIALNQAFVRPRCPQSIQNASD